MTQSEIKEITDKLEHLLLKIEADLGFEDRKTFHLLEPLLEYHQELEEKIVRLEERNRQLEMQMMLSFEKYSPQVNS